MKTVFLAILFLQSPPAIDGWNIVTKFHYEIKNYLTFEEKTQTATSYIGFLTIFKNPEDDEEFVLQILKYPPVTIIPRAVTDELRKSSSIIENFALKTKQDELEKRLALSDAIVFVRWRESKDLKTNAPMLKGRIDNWIRVQGGEWVFKSTNTPELEIELVSESIANQTSDTALVGFKFSINGSYHILRIDQKDLTVETGGVK